MRDCSWASWLLVIVFREVVKAVCASLVSLGVCVGVWGLGVVVVVILRVGCMDIGMLVVRDVEDEIIHEDIHGLMKCQSCDICRISPISLVGCVITMIYRHAARHKYRSTNAIRNILLKINNPNAINQLHQCITYSLIRGQSAGRGTSSFHPSTSSVVAVPQTLAL